MSARREITIDFKKDGTVEMEGHNFKGADCDQAMGAIEEALGIETARANKPEYHAQQGQQAQQSL